MKETHILYVVSGMKAREVNHATFYIYGNAGFLLKGSIIYHIFLLFYDPFPLVLNLL